MSGYGMTTPEGRNSGMEVAELNNTSTYEKKEHRRERVIFHIG